MINQQPADLRLTIVKTFAELTAFNTGELEPGVIAFVSDLGIFYKLLADRTWAPTTEAAATVEDVTLAPSSESLTPDVETVLGTIVIPAGTGVLWDVEYSLTLGGVTGASGTYDIHVQSAPISDLGSLAIEVGGTLVPGQSIFRGGKARLQGIATPLTIQLSAAVLAPITGAVALNPFLSARVAGPATA